MGHSLRGTAIALLVAYASSAVAEVPRDQDGYVHVYSIAGSGGNYSYALYLDPQKDRCVDAIPSTQTVSENLHGIANTRPPDGQANARVSLERTRLEVHPPTIRVEGDTPVISSAAFVIHDGLQIFLHCNYLWETDYEVYVATDAFAR